MKASRLVIGIGALTTCLVSALATGQVINEDFTNGPGTMANYNADIFFVADGQLTVGTNQIQGGQQGGLEYSYALSSTNVDSGFVLDADVMVVNTQEFRAGVVYGWTGPQNYYIAQLNDYENGVLHVYVFEGDPLPRAIGWTQFDFERDRWYDVRIEVSGDLHRVFLDGNLELEGTDAGYAGGQIGLAAGFNGYGKFDNLVVIPEPATLSLLLFGGIVALKRRR